MIAAIEIRLDDDEGFFLVAESLQQLASLIEPYFAVYTPFSRQLVRGFEMFGEMLRGRWDR
jgi:hypothetical protein